MNNSSCPPSPPTPPRHGPGHHGPHVPPGMEGLPFLFRRGGHCHRRRGAHGHGHGHGHGPDQDQNQSSGAEDNERPATAPGKRLNKSMVQCLRNGRNRNGRMQKSRCSQSFIC